MQKNKPGDVYRTFPGRMPGGTNSSTILSQEQEEVQVLPEQVDEMLEKYRLCVGKSKHLKIEIDILTMRIGELKSSALGDAALTCQQYDDMPHGSETGDPTGRVAIRFADGYKPQYIIDNENDLRELIEQKAAADATVLFVESWLQSLEERERFIVEGKMVDKKSWREIIDGFQARYGIIYSKAGVKRIKERALEKIYLIAS